MMEQKLYLCPDDILSHPKKTLIKHLSSVQNIAQKFCPHLLSDNLKEAISLIAKLHDMGKATSFFQEYIRADDNTKIKLKNKKETNHSLISAIITYIILKNNFPEDFFIHLYGFLSVKHHHGDLSSILNSFTFESSDWEAFEKQINSIPDECWQNMLNALSVNIHIENLKSQIKNFKQEASKIRNKIRDLKDNNIENFFFLISSFPFL